MSLFRFVQRFSEGQPVIVYGDGNQERDFTYVDDIARGTLATLKPMCFDSSTSLRAAQAQQSGYELINLGSDEPIVLNEAIPLVDELVGKKANIEYRPRHPADVLATWAHIGKAEPLPGWQAETSFEEGVRKTVVWYQENQPWAKEVQT